jgi:hypothetical protein
MTDLVRYQTAQPAHCLRRLSASDALGIRLRQHARDEQVLSQSQLAEASGISTVRATPEDWVYLGSGVMVQTDIGALVHFVGTSGTELVPIAAL